ncbi:hypothetical protein M9H77_31614 [Catharanthus roseus]|uniref:Uncharacterized protein n=1 Tax=Catharanthus roseus TaxID=4058 RepID=A0ACC0A1V4_CATRO|nr:hypothetical protein M9H77_31614 [Catharanthus roseus]
MNRVNQIIQVNKKLNVAFKSIRSFHSASGPENVIEKIARTINDHPFPDKQLHHRLLCEIPRDLLSTSFVEQVLGRLFGAHSNGLKAYQFFKFSLLHSQYNPSSDAFEKTLHILTRMRYFDKAWELMEDIKRRLPSLLSLKSMSIMLSRIAKFRSYEETLEAFERMEKDIFSGKEFGIEEFNILLRAFCTQRQMKEARSVFNKFHSRFSPNTKTMNILLLGFKESGDITSVELFYHEMIRRGFKPNHVTYNIRIDAYCKKGCFGDALRLFEEMEHIGLSAAIETITTLIHGAGIARNVIKARQLFDEISRRGLHADTGAYNALMNSLIRCRDLNSAAALFNEMEEKNLQLDNVTYHTVFWGLMRSKSTDAVSDFYQKMIDRKFVPKTRTVVALMKFFCENRRLDFGLNLWNYIVKKGQCPHCHALDILVTGLCSRGRVEEAFECSRQMLERGRNVSELTFRMLETYLLQTGEMDRLQKLGNLRTGLHAILPPSEHATGSC